MKAPRSLQEVKNSLTAREYSLTKLVEFYLKNIEEKQNLNAFLEVWEKEALEKSLLIQKKIESGTAGKLAGMVIGLKDNIVYKGHKV